MPNNPVVHFEIPATDPESLSTFYSQLFDWKIEKFPMDGQPYYIITTTETDEQGMPTKPGGINGGLMTRQMQEQQPINYVSVDTVDAYLEKAQRLGATLVVGKTEVPQMGWFAVIMDPDSNTIGLWQTA
jgi:predicted enzyme related to lactoylglutathione lyase